MAQQSHLRLVRPLEIKRKHKNIGVDDVMRNISFDASKEAKLKKEDVKGYANHVFRKMLDKKINHSNDKIDDSKTHMNEDYLIDGENIFNRMDNRLKDYNGKRKLRSDAVYARGLILQPSADVFEGKNDEEKKEIMGKFTNDVLPWLSETFNGENIMGMSEHHDETSPHLHVAVMPMTDDGRMSQKDFFKGPKSLKAMHGSLREHMNTLGWEFDLENKYESAEGYDTKEYKANAENIEANRIKTGELEKREESLDEREITVSTKEQELEQRESSLLSKESALDERENDIAQQELKHKRREEDFKRKIQAFNKRVREFNARMKSFWNRRSEILNSHFDAVEHVQNSKISEWEKKPILEALTKPIDVHEKHIEEDRLNKQADTTQQIIEDDAPEL